MKRCRRTARAEDTPQRRREISDHGCDNAMRRRWRREPHTRPVPGGVWPPWSVTQSHLVRCVTVASMRAIAHQARFCIDEEHSCASADDWLRFVAGWQAAVVEA
eukprot:1311954-Prymnesium_polylepis.1